MSNYLKLIASTLVGAVGLLMATSSSAAVFTCSPASGAGTPSCLFGTLVDFDDQATGTTIFAGDYASVGVASIVETTGSGAAFMRRSGSQSSPNYIGTGAGYDIGGSSSGGWDGVFEFTFASLASKVGIGIANSVGDSEVLEIFDANGNLIDSTTAPNGSNVYVGFDLFGASSISMLRVTCDFCALDDLQFTVPEPGTLALMSLGLFGVAGMRRKFV